MDVWAARTCGIAVGVGVGPEVGVGVAVGSGVVVGVGIWMILTVGFGVTRFSIAVSVLSFDTTSNDSVLPNSRG